MPDEMLVCSNHSATALNENTIVVYGGLESGGNTVRVLHLGMYYIYLRVEILEREISHLLVCFDLTRLCCMV